MVFIPSFFLLFILVIIVEKLDISQETVPKNKNVIHTRKNHIHVPQEAGVEASVPAAVVVAAQAVGSLILQGVAVVGNLL